jgi:hypothetical protein
MAHDPVAHLRDAKKYAEWKEHCTVRAGRFQGRRKSDPGLTSDPFDYIKQGGIQRREHVAAAEAADQAIEHEREFWLPILEGWLAGEIDPCARQYVEQDVKRIRRALGIATPDEVKRAQTRERVRLHRARKAG